MEVWNGTSVPVSDCPDVATDLSGTVLGSGDSQDIEPQNLGPDEIVFGMVFFEQSIPAGSNFNFTVNAKDGTSTYYLDAKVTQANFVSGPNGRMGQTCKTGVAMNRP